MGLFDIFNKKKKERERQEQQEAEAKRRADEQRRQEETHRHNEEQRKQQEQQRQDAILSNFDFDSNCHQRYENGTSVKGVQVCPRFIKIRKNTNGCSGYQLKKGDGYILMATNGDTGKPQFAPKPMRVAKFTDTEILLKGYTVPVQTPFGWQDIDLSDYGFLIKLSNGKTEKCILYLYDRNVQLEYMIKDTSVNSNFRKELTETEGLVNEALSQLKKGNDGDATYHPLFLAWCSYKRYPEQLKNIQNNGNYGQGLMCFLSYETITDIDDKQQLASLSYLYLSKAIKENPSNINLYKIRLLLMISNHEAFQYTVSSVVNKNVSILSPMASLSGIIARDALYKMEFSDLSINPKLLSINPFKSKYQDLRTKIASNFFGQNQTEELIIAKGNEHHNEVLEYLEKRVFTECDIDF